MRVCVFLLVMLVLAPATAGADDKEKGEGWSGEAEARPEKVAVDASENDRYYGAIHRLTDALNDEDEEAYLACFSERLRMEREEAGDPLTGVFEFMTRVLATAGLIDTFHPLEPEGYVMPGSESIVRVAIFHLEDGTPGYYGIALDEEDDVDHFSIFVKEGICKAGSDCEEADPLPTLDTDR